VNPDNIGYVWTGKFLYPERKSCGFKNIRIRVDEALDPFRIVIKKVESKVHIIAKKCLLLLIKIEEIQIFSTYNDMTNF